MRHFVFTRAPIRGGKAKLSVYEVKTITDVVLVAADIPQGYKNTGQAVSEIISEYVPELRLVPEDYKPKGSERVSEDRRKLRWSSGFSAVWAYALHRAGKIKLTQL